MRVPDDTQRHVIMGATGSGKTQYGLWSLSTRSYTKIPWIIFDFKGDKTIAKLEDIGAKVIDVKSAPPTRKGIYIVRPFPDQKEDVDNFLWKVWKNEHTGIYVDEGYMISDGKAFRALLTQGRSKHIPIITLSQRPVFMTRFVWSEAEFFNVFNLSVTDDRKAVRGFVPLDPKAGPLPKFHSYYYDVGDNRLSLVLPVPEESVILDTFRTRLAGRRRFV